MMLEGISKYPLRPRFFALLYVRLLANAEAVMAVGADGCWLLTQLAMMEDRNFYRGPLLIWNAQLARMVGRSVDQASRIRQKAIDAGWLHYEDTRPGRYWVVVPPEYRDLPDFARCQADNGYFRISADLGESPEDSYFRISADNHADNHADIHAAYSIPSLNPIPKKEIPSNAADAVPPEDDSTSKPDTSKKKTRKNYGEHFERFWKVYPKRVEKKAAADKFRIAVGDVAKSKHVSDAEAVEIIIRSAERYAASVKDPQYTKYPATWLNKGCWDDEPTNGRPQPCHPVVNPLPPKRSPKPK